MKNFVLLKGLSILACIFAFASISYGQDDLFGDLESLEADLNAPVAETSADAPADPFAPAAPAAPVKTIEAFTGTFKILISRPIYAPYNEETKTKWISAIGEMFFHYKVGSFPRTYAFTPGQIDDVLPNFRDYSRRISKQAYIDAAKKLGATHLLYMEYEPQGGKSVRFAIELYDIAQKIAVSSTSQSFNLSNFEAGLNDCLFKITEAMDPGSVKTQAYNTTVFGKKKIEDFGDALASEGNFTRSKAAAALESVEKLANQNSKMVGFRYSAAALAARAGAFDKAIEHMNAVVAQSGDYPALHLRLASYYREAARYSEALTAASVAASSPSLTTPVARERAIIYQNQGNLDQARNEYNSILNSGEADGSIYFRLALLSVQMGRLSESTDYLSKASSAGLTLDESEYFQLGKAYSSLSGQEDLALDYLKKSQGMMQDNQEGWKLSAEIYERIGNTDKAAECYTNLFQLDNQKNKDKLKLAGEMYEKSGNINKAKDAYLLFVERKFVDPQVSLSLAKIYYNERDCKSAADLLRNIDTLPSIRAEAEPIMNECEPKRGNVGARLDYKKTSPVVLAIRWGSVAIAAGGAVGGYLMDEDVKKLGEEYHAAQNKESAMSLHNDIESKKSTRTGLYAIAGAALAGVTATFFF